MTRTDKILGAMVGAAVGNAMGAPLVTRPPYLIKQDLGNGNYVKDYVDMPFDSPLQNVPRGTVSYDFAIAFQSLTEFIQAGGVTEKAAIKAVLDLKENKKYQIYYSRVDQTSKVATEKLEGVVFERTPYDDLPVDNRNITNGGAMKSWVCGLLNPGNVEKAIQDAIVMCKVTHDNVIALSGACSVAAAVSVAMVSGTLLSDIIEAGIEGARKGYEKTLRIAWKAAGASVEERIKMAVEIGIKYSNDFEKCITEMGDLIGCGINANETVPAAFGFLAAAGGDVMKTILLAINAGNDSDTTGTIAGAMAGAFKGIDNIPQHHLSLISSVNHLEIEKVANEVSKMIS